MMHIALTIDKHFTRFCAVTIVSILEHNNGKDIAFHIITDDLPQQARDTLEQIVQRYRSSILFYIIPPQKVSSYQVKWEKKRISIVTFYRCMLSSILPENITKVLYLDCDLLVLDKLDELWNTNIDSYALAAVPDDFRVNTMHPSQLEYDAAYNYFNGGVLLLNLNYWRIHDIENNLIAYYRKNPDKIIYNDQDLLNGFLYDKKVLVSMKWNLQEGAYRKSNNKIPHDFSYKYLITHPSILHFSSRKPWQYHCTHPLRHLFFIYQDLTPWKGENVLNNWRARLHRFWHLLPYKIHLKKNKYIQLDK